MARNRPNDMQKTLNLLERGARLNQSGKRRLNCQRSKTTLGMSPRPSNARHRHIAIMSKSNSNEES